MSGFGKAVFLVSLAIVIATAGTVVVFPGVPALWIVPWVTPWLATLGLWIWIAHSAGRGDERARSDLAVMDGGAPHRFAAWALVLAPVAFVLTLQVVRDWRRSVRAASESGAEESTERPRDDLS